MPGMSLDDARGGMISSDRENIRFFAQQNWQGGVELLNRLFLRGEVTVFTIHVRVFVMNEEEVVVLVFAEVTLELFGNALRSFELGHPDQLSQSLIHGINSNAARPQAVTVE